MKIGILGSGQLAKMLALAAYPLSFSTRCYDNSEGCAQQVTHLTCGDFNNINALKEWASQCDVITFENENIDLITLDHVGAITPMYPSRKALAMSQDRLFEKNYFQQHQIPCAHYCTVDSLESLYKALDIIGFPAVLKTRRMGYDGKGQHVLRDKNDIPISWESFKSNDWICEQWIHFQTEVSQIAVRDQFNHLHFYPLTENTHQHGILQISRSPCHHLEWQSQAQRYTRSIMENLDYIGVMTVEFFVTPEDILIANEIAPRVHNSGHWTIEGAYTSQFENHIRAITQLPLGRTDAITNAAMINCIGKQPDVNALLAIQGSHYHWYGKNIEPSRKVGHITLLAESTALLTQKINAVNAILHG
jgi:5-(carboxyamino)imidazole ribonucleotide synthase